MPDSVILLIFDRIQCLRVMDTDLFSPIIPTSEAQTSKEVLAQHFERGGCNVSGRERRWEGG